MDHNSNKSIKRVPAKVVERTKHNSEFLLKLKDHLKVLFQFDCTDLDFGIYRIMNYKRKEIEKFIEDDLIGVVEKEFEKYRTQNQKELLERIEEKRKEICRLEKELGEKILKNSEIEEKFKDRPFAKEYLELKKQIDEIDVTEGIQSQVYNDLYNFFSRYYEDGDFISKRRYSSKQNKYAIPYSGEEVKLYWANFDQYYIKTGEVFKDYEFNRKDWKFVFRTVLADVEAGNVKGNRRYFLLSSDEPVKISNKACLIKFEYRMLINGDLKQYPVKTKEGKAKSTGITQDELNTILKDKILTFITPLEPKSILNEIQNDKSILEKHLYKYTRKITSDFFIHKNLKEFLKRELDYFIKTEVLDIESFDTEKERYFDRHITRAKVVKNIGERIIEFLSQIEDYQKMLWEKKKFVLKTDYVITTDRIPEDFYKEILGNKEQLKEWEELGLGMIKTKKDLNCKKLPVDTKYFSEEFKERLLEKLGESGNIDDLLDGILIKSENWQAINLILEKYREKIKCIYIDPPYNTGSDEFLYKDKYQHSSWLSMMENRLKLARELMKEDGAIFVSIDDNEVHNLRTLGEYVFGTANFIANVVWHKKYTRSNDATWFSDNHDHILTFARLKDILRFNLLPRTEKQLKAYLNPDNHPKGPWKATPLHAKSGSGTFEYTFKNGIKWSPPPGTYPRYSEETLARLDENNEIWFGEDGKSTPCRKTFLKEAKEGVTPITLWPYEEVGHNHEAVNELKALFPSNPYRDPKPTRLIKRIVELTVKVESASLILDHFAGSGTTAHAVMKLNKEDNGKRKYILVEMADYFDTVIVPRLKKVCYSFNWKDGKPQNTNGISQFFKYHYLEQYEDTLHNIEFPQEQRAQKMLDFFDESAKTEYLMKYMLKFETEGSPSLLNLQQFESPFEYKLKIISSGKGEEIVNVDLIETFNYLVGLKIDRYKFLKENRRKYVFVFGERNSRKTAIVWRPIKAIDLKKDIEIIDKVLGGFNPDEIFINGDSFVKGYKPIESEFKTLMGV